MLVAKKKKKQLMHQASACGDGGTGLREDEGLA